MNKDKTTNQDHVQPEAPKTEQAKKHYFFPNAGDASAFSVEATSLEEAIEANNKHLKETK